MTTATTATTTPARDEAQPLRRNYLDGCIEQLADDLAAMTERAAGYQQVAVMAAHRLRERDLECQGLRAQIAALRGEIRRYTSSRTMGAA